ncbi:hypothetical protein ACHHRT_00630 [Desulfurivibrio sp. D14AmB]|uniref:hypothetical protein n=1 Tax=Desulfurivibrio sp. D14AmB TaxID=3374370 RepID=UPI00376ED715
MTKDLLIRARIVVFTENAMHRRFRHGGCRFYDVTLLEILTPEELLGRRLPIHHDKDQHLADYWRRPNAVLRFKLSPKFLTDHTLFTGVAKEVSEEDSQE